MLPTLTPINITRREFEALRSLVYERSGISLNDTKMDLVRSRLASRLRALELRTFQEYHARLENDRDGSELMRCLDAITTNTTSFFREAAHLEHLEKVVVPRILAGKGRRKLRIWSAGCSSGEEPYSIAVVLQRLASELKSWDVKIVATDLSTKILALARAGRYTPERVASVPKQDLLRNFEKISDQSGTLFEVRSHLKRDIIFSRLNLVRDQFPFRGCFDVIFCRNVMIYFDRPTRERLVNRFHDFTLPGGQLFIGHSETLNGIVTPWRYIRPTVYERVA